MRVLSRGLSLHIGLNRIDPAHYGTAGTLAGCENDARAMERIASSLGYRTRVLLTAQATADEVLDGIRDAADELQSGDTLLLTYAGHGAQVGDASSDEDDGSDETWCTYDRMVLDDELAALWPLFRPGVLVTIVSDSCHSGTVLRSVVGGPVVAPEQRRGLAHLAGAIYGSNRALYDGLRAQASRLERSSAQVGVLLLSGCQDHQFSADGVANGLFTENLLRAWDDGRFAGDYESFVAAIRQRMPPQQTPSLRPDGAGADFIPRKPFALVDAPQGGQQAPADPVPAPGQCHCVCVQHTCHAS